MTMVMAVLYTKVTCIDSRLLTPRKLRPHFHNNELLGWIIELQGWWRRNLGSWFSCIYGGKKRCIGGGYRNFRLSFILSLQTDRRWGKCGSSNLNWAKGFFRNHWKVIDVIQKCILCSCDASLSSSPSISVPLFVTRYLLKCNVVALRKTCWSRSGREGSYTACSSSRKQQKYVFESVNIVLKSS